MERVVSWLWPAVPLHSGDPYNRERVPQPAINIIRLAVYACGLCFVAYTATSFTLLVWASAAFAAAAILSGIVGLVIYLNFD